MKKSEMIRKLMIKFDEMSNKSKSPLYIDGLNPIYDFEAEEIIDFLISEGMLPPTIELSKLNAIDNTWEDE